MTATLAKGESTLTSFALLPFWKPHSEVLAVPDRSELLQVRLTEAEQSRLERRAESAGVTVSKFVRQSIEDGEIIDTEPIEELARQIRAVGINMNQVAQWCNQHGLDADTAKVMSALVHIERQIQSIQDEATPS